MYSRDWSPEDKSCPNLGLGRYSHQHGEPVGYSWTFGICTLILSSSPLDKNRETDMPSLAGIRHGRSPLILMFVVA